MNFIVYSRDGCPYCTKIIKVLDLIEANFVEYKLNRDFTREEFYGEFGKGTTFPQILMDQKKLGGCSETVKYLREQKLL
jgi:glutaredoxin